MSSEGAADDQMRLMALDVGDRRIGVALSDPGRVLARSLRVIRRRSLKADMEVMRSLVEEHAVEKIVVGHPLRLDGSAGKQARRAEGYAAELERAVGVPVVLWDEAFSTDRARQVMIEAGKRRKEREERLDAVAAAVILQDYLDSLGRDQ
ncbi:MAG TPA: Holliday junction resolvase RuvX [Anaerolineae bacterium]|nr:Holliday junction resolvase RuvX [Anaerolineae bacterium]